MVLYNFWYWYYFWVHPCCWTQTRIVGIDVNVLQKFPSLEIRQQLALANALSTTCCRMYFVYVCCEIHSVACSVQASTLQHFSLKRYLQFSGRCLGVFQATFATCSLPYIPRTARAPTRGWTIDRWPPVEGARARETLARRSYSAACRDAGNSSRVFPRSSHPSHCKKRGIWINCRKLSQFRNIPFHDFAATNPHTWFWRCRLDLGFSFHWSISVICPKYDFRHFFVFGYFLMAEKSLVIELTSLSFVSFQKKFGQWPKNDGKKPGFDPQAALPEQLH